jgi:cobalt/nickel transport protein
MKLKLLGFLAAAVMVLSGTPASAHFQMLYTPDSAMTKPKAFDLKLVFTHPFEAGHTMDMDTPEEFFVVHKGKKKDLAGSLKEIKWKSLSNSGKAYEAGFKPRGMGDWVFGLVPAPYYESNEDCYIQQMTKMVVNTVGIPTDWDSRLGLPAEIVPLDKPYGLWEGNVFRGEVLKNGEPVPYAEIEVEFLNHEPDMNENEFEKEAEVEAPQDCFVTQTIKADKNGQFVYAVPHEGWWGFCALGVGPETEYKGKELSQDAVIWVQAREMD